MGLQSSVGVRAIWRIKLLVGHPLDIVAAWDHLTAAAYASRQECLFLKSFEIFFKE